VRIYFKLPRYYRGKWYAAGTEADVAHQYGRAFVRSGAAVPVALAPRRKPVALAPVSAETVEPIVPTAKTPTDYMVFSYAKLQKLCKGRGLLGSGKKTELAQRLLEDDAK